MFRNLSVLKKIILLMSLFLVSMLIIQVMGFKTMITMSSNTKNMYKNRLEPTIILSKYRINNRAILADIWQSMTETEDSTAAFLRSDIQNKFKESRAYLNQYKDSKLTSEEAKIVNNLIKIYPVFEESVNKAFDLAFINRNSEAQDVYNNDTKHYFEQIISYGTQLDKINSEQSIKLYESNQHMTSSTIWSSLVFFIVLAAISILLGIYIIRMIVNPIKEILVSLKATQSGDFTQIVNYKSKDELGAVATALNDTTSSLRDLIGEVKETSEQVAAFSSELSASAEQTSEASEHIATVTLEVASGADDQVRTIEETSQTVKGMVGEAQNIGDNSIKVNEAAKNAEELSMEGNKVIQKAVEQMNSIHDSIGGLNTVILELGERSSQIGQIVEVITGIADQTNLLALNAAIEAARAGEQGKGFAVVSAEVRKLAEESAGSANKISALINAIQNEVKKAMKSMEITTSQVEIGANNVNQAGISFGKILSSINEVSSQIHEVSSSVQQMAAGTEQLGQSIVEINTIAQNSASGTQNISAATEEQLATMQEIAASSTALAKMAEDLQTKISAFTV